MTELRNDTTRVFVPKEKPVYGDQARIIPNLNKMPIFPQGTLRNTATLEEIYNKFKQGTNMDKK
jgi:hypothetical protein